jgi:hypothetical protein
MIGIAGHGLTLGFTATASEMIAPDEALGREAISSGRTKVTKSGTVLRYLSGSIEPKGTDLVWADSRLDAGLFAQGSMPVHPKASARGGLKYFLQNHSTEESVSGQQDSRTMSLLSGNLDGTYYASDTLDLFAGLGLHWLPGYEVKTKINSDALSTKKIAGAFVIDPRIGLLKRSAQWAGGLHFSFGGHSKRTFSTVARDDTSNSGKETVFVPSALGIFALFPDVFTLQLDFEARFWRAAEGIAKDEDGGNNYRDFFDVNFGAVWLALPGIVTTRYDISHRTAIYSDPAYMDLDKIATTSLQVSAEAVSYPLRPFVSFLFAFGSDHQNIPEVSAKYSVYTSLLKAGCHLPL